MAFDTTVAMGQYRKRRQANEGKEKIDNSRLYAGSPMYYYCKFCGDHTQTLPESHRERPKTVCDPCKPLREMGLIGPNGEPLDGHGEQPKSRYEHINEDES